jgi:hypothetical protein
MLPNRIAVILTPVLSAAGGWIFRELSKVGVHYDKATGTAAFVTGALAVATPFLVWLYNWGKHEANVLLRDIQPPVEPPTDTTVAGS